MSVWRKVPFLIGWVEGNLDETHHFFGACCLDVRTLTFCQPMAGFSNETAKKKLLAGEQKATEEFVWVSSFSPTHPAELEAGARRLG